MANVDKAFGLKPLGNLSATGAQKQYGYQIQDSQAGAIYQGDLVTLSGGYVVKFDAALHTVALGVFNGCNYIDPTTGKPIWSNFYPGSVNITAGTISAEVVDDPNQLFLIQADEDVVQADIGLNASIAYTAGSATTGVSGTELDSSTIANVAAGRVLKIVGFYDAPENTPGENFVDVVVKINAHLYGSAGVANTAPAP
jgi:hypothetical protein